MSTLSNPLYVGGQYRNVTFPKPFTRQGETAGIVSTKNDPFSMAVSVADAQRDFDSRRNVHREILGECAGAQRLQKGVNAIAVTGTGKVDPQMGECDAAQPLVHPGELDEWANTAGIEIDSYGTVKEVKNKGTANESTTIRQPHFRTIIPRQMGGADSDSTAYLTIPNRIAEVRLSDRDVGRNIGTVMANNFRAEGMRDERACTRHNYRCGAGIDGPSDEARTGAYDVRVNAYLRN